MNRPFKTAQIRKISPQPLTTIIIEENKGSATAGLRGHLLNTFGIVPNLTTVFYRCSQIWKSIPAEVSLYVCFFNDFLFRKMPDYE